MRKLAAFLSPRVREHKENVAQVERRLSVQERTAASHERRLKRLELELGIVVPDILRDTSDH